MLEQEIIKELKNISNHIPTMEAGNNVFNNLKKITLQLSSIEGYLQIIVACLAIITIKVLLI